jgi:hypothetical protein
MQLKWPFSKKTKISFSYLNRFNWVMAALHLVQAVVMITIAKSFYLPVTTTFLTFNDSTKQLETATRNLFDVQFAGLTVAFLVMSAIAHIVVATIYRKKYESDLKKGINKARWIEYAVSASTMMVAIAMLSGIYELSNLFMIFILVAIMNLMGLGMELWNQLTKKTNWYAFVVGCVSGIAPWIVFAIYVWGASVFGTNGVPGFVYGIYASIFVFFNCFAINMYLQYKKVGPWKDYLFGERVYMILSLVAKSALAWQVFAGSLRP